MTGEVIKQFLVGLGFGVDEGSLSKFNKAITSASIKVTALYAATKVMAAGVFYSISKISESFEQMGYEYRLISPAINKTLQLRQELMKAYRAAGIDILNVVKQSVLFNFSLTKTKYALDAVYKSVGAKFLPLLTKQMDIFRGKIYANMPKIQAMLERFVKIVFKAFEATTILGGRVWSILQRVWDFFARLDQATDGWSTKILAAVAAWKLLNLSFIATPLGMILTGLLAILALWDDFKTFEEGGESFINWKKLMPIIDSVKAAIGSLANVWRSLVDVVLNTVLAFQQLFSGDFNGFFDSLKEAAMSVLGIFNNLAGVINNLAGGLNGAASAIGDKVSGLFGGGGGGALSGVAHPSPLMGGAGGNTQHVSQETNINIQGSPDAHATGKAVANEQGKVNFDLTRNLKGATR